MIVEIRNTGEDKDRQPVDTSLLTAPSEMGIAEKVLLVRSGEIRSESPKIANC